MSSQKRRRIDDSDDDEPFRPAIDPSLAKGDSDVDYDDNEDEDNDDDENNNGVDDGPRRNVMRPYLERMNRRAAGEDDDSFDGDQDEDEGEGEVSAFLRCIFILFPFFILRLTKQKLVQSACFLTRFIACG